MNPLWAIIVVILVLLLLGALAPIGGGPYLGLGYYRGGLPLGTILVILIIVLLLLRG